MEEITLEKIKELVEKIRACARDDEAAHGMEDDLYRLIIEAISEDQRITREMAKEVLKTSDISFARWCA